MYSNGFLFSLHDHKGFRVVPTEAEGCQQGAFPPSSFPEPILTFPRRISTFWAAVALHFVASVDVPRRWRLLAIHFQAVGCGYNLAGLHKLGGELLNEKGIDLFERARTQEEDRRKGKGLPPMTELELAAFHAASATDGWCRFLYCAQL